MNIPLVIYHADCRDGFCAAWVCRQVLSDAEFHAAHYGTEPPDAAGRDVFVVDFSYPRAVMERMAAEAGNLLVLDHHVTAQEALAGLPFARFDMNRSGAGMAWDHFFPRKKRPWIVDYVEDRDLWRNSLPHTHEANAWISCLSFDFKIWSRWAFGVGVEGAPAALADAIRAGEFVLAKTDRYVEAIGKNARLVRFADLVVPCVNAPQFDISELLSGLAEKSPSGVALGWWQRNDGMFQYSLRSRGVVDVSALAKRYGGGGHRLAAGFQIPQLLVLTLVELREILP